MNILHLTPDFNYTDGRSYYVYLILKYLKTAGYNVFLCSNAGDSFDRVKEIDVPVFIHPKLSNRSSFIGSTKLISHLASENKIDIIHSYHRHYELLANSISKKKSTGTVFTALSIVSRRYYVEYKSDRIIAVSNCVKDMLINKFGVVENKISLIPNFIDSDSLNENRQPSIVNREFIYILSIGRFHEDKNFETLLKAMALLKEYKIKLILIGEGEEKSKYEKLIKEKSIDAELITPQRKLKPFFDTTDICVLPSVRDPLPGFMLQSGLHRKPFIGSNTDGIAEVISDNENGLLFEKQNEFQLAEKIKLFINDKLFAKKCAENLNKLVVKKFTEKTVMPEIINLYNKLLTK